MFNSAVKPSIATIHKAHSFSTILNLARMKIGPKTVEKRDKTESIEKYSTKFKRHNLLVSACRKTHQQDARSELVVSNCIVNSCTQLLKRNLAVLCL